MVEQFTVLRMRDRDLMITWYAGARISDNLLFAKEVQEVVFCLIKDSWREGLLALSAIPWELGLGHLELAKWVEGSCSHRRAPLWFVDVPGTLGISEH